MKTTMEKVRKQIAMAQAMLTEIEDYSEEVYQGLEAALDEIDYLEDEQPQSLTEQLLSPEFQKEVDSLVDTPQVLATDYPTDTLADSGRYPEHMGGL